MRGFGKIVTGQVPDTLIRPGAFVLLVAGAALFAPRHMSADVAILLQAIGACLGFVVGTVMLARALPRELRHAKPEFHVRNWLSSSIPIAATSLLRTAQPSLAVLLVGALSSSEATGLFRLAQRSSDLVAFASNTIVSLTPPYLARYVASRDLNRLQRLSTLMAQASTAGALVVGVGLAVMGPTLLSKLFGTAFERSYAPMLVLIASQVIFSFFGANSLLLNMAHKERALAAAFLLAVAVQTSFTIVFVPTLGSIAAAYALLLSNISWNVLSWWVARKQIGVRTTAFGL